MNYDEPGFKVWVKDTAGDPWRTYATVETERQADDILTDLFYDERFHNVVYTHEGRHPDSYSSDPNCPSNYEPS